MPEPESEIKTVSAAELAKQIQHLQCYGEYDQYHDWSLYFTLDDKTAALEKMLAAWDETDSDGRKLILAFIETLIKDNRNSCAVLTNLLVRHLQNPGVFKLVFESLESGSFCICLLSSMKLQNIKSDDLTAVIKSYFTARSFVERKRPYNVQEIYNRLEALLAE
jgi:hypothetical protein